MERERDREMRYFSFVFEIYNFYFSIFQDNYVVLLMNLSDINFDFSIFQEWVYKFFSYNLILFAVVWLFLFFPFLIFYILGYNGTFLMHFIDQ